MRVKESADESGGFLSGLWRLIAPARQAPAPPLPQPAAPVAADPPAPPNGKRVLLVDDDAVIRATTASELRANGYTAISAVDCSEAIGAVRDERPDLILLDLNFPPNVGHCGVVSWDGFDLMSWLRQFQHTSRIPIIMLTAQDTPCIEARALKAGARALFHKPIDHGRLLQTIGQVLGVEVEDAPLVAESA